MREARTTRNEGSRTNITSTPYLDILKGRDGRDGLPGLVGRDGQDGEQGKKGEEGEKGDPGVQGLPGPQGEAGRSGVVYTRWGRTTCPNVQGTELVYSGRAGGSHYSHKGGASNYLCMPDNPQYSTFKTGVGGFSYIYGVEYKLENGLPIPYNRNNHNVPCAVCYVQERGTLLMIPARKDCPNLWTKEYDGALMSERVSYHRTMFECVDQEAESVPGSAVSTSPAQFYPVEASCTGMACPPYDAQKELLCVVCTK